MDQGQVLLVNLAKGHIGEDSSFGLNIMDVNDLTFESDPSSDRSATWLERLGGA
jgi:hypothetical protein